MTRAERLASAGSKSLDLPYTMVLKRDDEGDFVGRIEELQGCVAHGKNESEVIENLKKIQELWIQDCIEAGDPIPPPKETAAALAIVFPARPPRTDTVFTVSVVVPPPEVTCPEMELVPSEMKM